MKHPKLFTACIAALSMSLGACGIHLESSATHLPALTGFALSRDASARTEAAAAQRAHSLAALASECSSCASSLEALAQSSQQRLDFLGGVWDPWKDQENSADLPQPEEVAEAPYTIEEFVSWLVISARRDLRAASNPTTSSPEQSRQLSAVALGRYASAVQLAQAYAIDIDAGDQGVDALAQRFTQATGATPNWLVRQGASSDLTLPQPSQTISAFSSSDEAAASTASWDCIAQTLPKSAVHTTDFYEAETIENALLDRASRSLERGSKDSRQLRCSLTNTSPSDLAQASLRADVNLLQSESQDVRLFGVQAALDDLRLWAGAPTITFPAVVTLQ